MASARSTPVGRASTNVLFRRGAGGFDLTPWADRVQLIDAKYIGTWELPAIGAVTAPTAVLIRPDGYVAWVGEPNQLGLAAALATWFGPPTAA
jgi:3-(3-hydroxy-phenyl)propionate hydroxylase